MDLLQRVLVLAVVVVAAIAIVNLAVHGSSQPVTKVQAVANITKFLQQSNPPGTIINVTSVSTSQYAGSWHIVTGVIQNGTSPCPSYYVYSFDYPQYGLVSRLENNYTANCIVNGISSSNYVIGYYPVAIARSYSLHIPSVMSFVNQYGYSNVVIQATKVSKQTINGVNYSGVWIVYYSAPAANKFMQVYLQANGTFISTT